MTPYDEGHEYRTEKYGIDHISHRNWFASGINNAYYRGPLVVPSILAPGDNLGITNGRSVIGPINLGVGTTLLNKSAPTNPIANIAQMFAELVQDLPSIPFTALAGSTLVKHQGKTLVRGVGSEYLNAVFAWTPLVSDVLKICDAIVRSEEIVQQYLRDAGPERAVRRRRRLAPTMTLKQDVTSGTTTLLPQPLSQRSTALGNLFPSEAARRGPISHKVYLYEEYKLSCAWTYYLSTDSSWYGQIQQAAEMARKVLGLKLDLELLWELAPWTWLADWFVNAGDFVSLNSKLAGDSLLLRYGYLTRKNTLSDEATHPGLTFWSGSTGPITTTYVYEGHERVRATPYGFGAKTGNFTNGQFAILAALGMTSSPSRAAWG